MRKILFLLTAILLGGVSSWAEINTSKCYYLKDNTFDCYVLIPSTDGNDVLRSTTDKSKVVFKQMEGGFSLRDADNEKYIGISSWYAKVAATAFAWKVTEQEDGTITIQNTEGTYKDGYFGSENGKTKYYNNKSKLTFTLIEAGDAPNIEEKVENRKNLPDVYLKSLDGGYLGINSTVSDMGILTEPYSWNINYKAGVDNAYSFETTYNNTKYYINSGTSGYLSKAAEAGNARNFFFYEVQANSLTGTLVEQPVAGKQYIVGLSGGGHNSSDASKDYCGFYLAYASLAKDKTNRVDVILYQKGENVAAPESITLTSEMVCSNGAINTNKAIWTIVDPNAKESLTYLRLQFSETTENSTTVSVVDKAGNAIEGASAELVGVQKKDGSSDPVTCTLQTQNGHLLTPQYTNAAGNGWILTFRLNGVTTGKFNKAAADLHAMNAQGGYQNDANIKYWTANLSTGTSEEAMTDFGTSARYGISDPQYQDGSTRHVEVAIPGGNTVEYADGMLVKLYVMKVEGGGCFAGVKYLDLLYVTPREKLANVLAEAGTHNVGESLGQYNAEGFAEAYASASAVSENQEASDEDVAAAASQLATAISNLTLNMPKVGQFFRIKASADHIGTPTYLTGEQNENNRIKFTQDAEEIAGANTIFCYFYTNGNYLACYGNGMTAANKSNFLGVAQYPSTTAIAFEPATTGKKTGKYNIKFAGSRYLYTNTGLYADAGSGSTAEGYNYELIEVTELPVAFHKDGQGYATLYSPAALQIPEGVEAYTLHAGTADAHLLAEQVSEVIPAGTAVVLKGTADTTKSFAVSKEEGTADELNVLTGTVPALAAGEGKYVFSVVGEEAGFYKFAGSNLAGFKAYYVPQASENVQGFVINFGGEQTTGIISATENANANGTCFDLQGRRVNAGVKGISIVNNKKVIK